MQSRLHCTKAVHLTHSDCYIRLEKSTRKTYFKRHDMQQEGQVHTSQLWLDKRNKGKCTDKFRSIIGKGSSIVTIGQWHSRAVSAHRSNQWGFNSYQAKNPHFGSSKKPDRGYTRKSHDCPGINWGKRHNRTQPITFYPNPPRWGSVTYFWFEIDWIVSQNCC